MTQASSANAQDLDSLLLPLHGSRLIEASAGTGKTWTIAALYLRFVLGHRPELGMDQTFDSARLPSEILVMTFTRAATRELSDRIRSRLDDAAKFFRGEYRGKDDVSFLKDLRDFYPEGNLRDQAAWRLATAADSMDEAAILTIDAWCQRMLKEHAFDSGSLFDEELIAVEDELRIEACQDYWRQQCYPLPTQYLESVLGVWSGVDKLISGMKFLLDKDLQENAPQDSIESCIHAVEKVRNSAMAAIKLEWRDKAQGMLKWLNVQYADNVLRAGWNGNRLQKARYTAWLETLIHWCSDPNDTVKPDLKTGWTRFTPNGMQEARTDKAPAIELHPGFMDFPNLIQAFDELPGLSEPLRKHAAVWISNRLAKLKRQSGKFGFVDMLHRLNGALSMPDSGERLRQRIRSQYPIALIDEFQDTSPLQFNIFDQIYSTVSNDDQTALLLIGDPKQSIYGFRGADIYSYLKARKATSGRHYVLDTNFRSTKPVVEIVNHLFARVDEDPGQHAGAFLFKTSHDNPLPFVRVKAKGRDESFVDKSGQVPALTLVHDLKNIESGESILKTFSALCAEQIVSWLNDPQSGFAQKNQKTISLRPKDIAVLVRTGKEANAVRTELSKRGISSVYLSEGDSVFESNEARDIYHWLRAVAMPRNVRFVRSALATKMIGLTLKQLESIAQVDEEFDYYAEQLRDLQVVWQSQGVLAMLRRTLHQFDMPVRWLNQADGERSLTNFLHLAELLQSASSNLDGEQALIRWFKTELDELSKASDEQILRLESDEDLVKVITIHKSKGLEYPVVLMPFVSIFRPAGKNDSSFVDVPDESGQRRVLLTLTDEQAKRADRERLKEDLRLLYVGLTRARHALWIGFSAFKHGQNSNCISHRSAMGYLLNGDLVIQNASDWIGPLKRFQDYVINDELSVDPNSLIRLIDRPQGEIPMTQLKASSVETELIEHPQYAADFDKNWSIGSFSRLTKDIAKLKTQLSVLQTMRPTDDESDLDVGIEPLQTAELPIWHTFQKGPVAGNFLHDQLEWLTGEGFDFTHQPDLIERLKRRCERQGYINQSDGIVKWLSAIVQTKLPGPGVSLDGLTTLLPEMEFWLPTTLIHTPRLDQLCKQNLLNEQPRPDLPDRELHGMLMGFVDLIFEYQGRYWVLDYKSNFLGKGDQFYDRVSLERSMAEHRYDMQAALYMLALHRLLKQRLGNQYDPHAQLGGALYFFLRGINGPEKGLYHVPPSVDMLIELDEMLNKAGVSA